MADEIHVKCTSNCTMLREEGNKYYKEGNLQKSLCFYNASIRHSTLYDHHYFYAMGNKSAVQFQKGHYDKAIQIISFLKSVAQPEIIAGTNFMDKLEFRFRKSQSEMKHMKGNKYNELSCHNKLKFPFANNAVKVVVIPAKGRSVISNANIRSSETIYCLKPFAATLGTSYWCTHCYTCFALIEESIIVPCDTCCEVQYCSVKCKNCSIVHNKYECPSINLVKQIGILHLSLVITLKFHANNNLDELVNFFCKGPNPICFNSPEKDLVSLLFSTGVREQLLIDCEDTFELMITHFPVLIKQEKSSYLITKKDIKLTLATIASQIMKNASSISYYNPKLKENIFIGSGIYPDLAIMNHSCYSNTVCLFNGIVVTVKAAYPIKCGSELYNSYGFDFENHTKDLRQAALKKQYDFLCQCEACLNDWKKDENFRFIQCPNCSQNMTFGVSSIPSHCQVCLVNTDFVSLINELEILYKRAFTSFENNDIQEVLDIMINCSFSQIKLRILKLPDPLLLDWNDLLKKSLIISDASI